MDKADKDITQATHQSEDKEKEIDLLDIVYKLWSNKLTILVWCMWGIIAGLVIAFSIPKSYTTEVTLAPEATEGSGGLSGGLGTLASMAGISSGGGGSDAVYPLLYPNIVKSVPFATSLFDVPVTDEEGNVFTVKDFLLTETKSPWWSYITKLPGKIIASFSAKEVVDKDHVTNNFRLTKGEERLVKVLNACISADVDQKTDVITIRATMQDPMVSAVLADTVVMRLRQYITNYRTNKARQDLEYAEMLNAEAQEEYYKAQQKLADYMDRNQNLATRSAQVTRDRLQNEATLAFNLYNATSVQVQTAKSKVQETTPVYTVITPATVPIKASSPKKLLIIFAFTFLAFAACCAWILFGKNIIQEYKQKVKENTDNSQDSKSDMNSDFDNYEIDGNET